MDTYIGNAMNEVITQFNQRKTATIANDDVVFPQINYIRKSKSRQQTYENTAENLHTHIVVLMVD